MHKIKKIIIEEYYNIINEALPLKYAKKYSSIQRKEEVKKRMNNIFSKLKKYSPNIKSSKRGDRIYIPFNPEGEIDIKSNIKNEIENFLKRHNYKISDYIKGIAKDQNGKEFKIGKLLNKLGNKDLLNKFQNDKSREGVKSAKESYIVISKHPYDIAGMSTGRGWTSCMNLDTGEDKEYVNCDIEEGTIIAYQIYINDLNIKNPIGRVLIKPFINEEDPSDIIYVPENKVYGSPHPEFIKIVKNIFLDIQDEDFSEYRIHPKLLPDTKSKHIGVINKIIKNPELINNYLDDLDLFTREDIKKMIIEKPELIKYFKDRIAMFSEADIFDVIDENPSLKKYFNK